MNIDIDRATTSQSRNYFLDMILNIFRILHASLNCLYQPVSNAYMFSTEICLCSVTVIFFMNFLNGSYI